MTTLTRARPPIPSAALPALAALAITFALIAALVVVSLTSAPAAAQASAQPTPAANIVAATPAIEIISAGQAGRLSDPINVYGGPDAQSMIGPVEKGRSFTPIAVSSDRQWLQVDVLGSGLVWTPAANIRNLNADGLAVVEAPNGAPPIDKVGTAPDGRALSVSAPSQDVAERVYQAMQSPPAGTTMQTQPDGTLVLTCNSVQETCSGTMELITLFGQLQCYQDNGAVNCNGRKSPEPTPAPAVVPTVQAEQAAPAVLTIESPPEEKSWSNVEAHPYVAAPAETCEWHPPMVIGTCD
jgi:hypothetical protein